MCRALTKAEKIGIPMTIAVVDDGCNLVAAYRMDGALLGSIDIAINKAFTSSSLHLSTADVGAMAQTGEPLFGIHTTNHCRIVIFGGGLPIKKDGKIIGGLGVSGGTVEEDIIVAEYALEEV